MGKMAAIRAGGWHRERATASLFRTSSPGFGTMLSMSAQRATCSRSTGTTSRFTGVWQMDGVVALRTFSTKAINRLAGGRKMHRMIAVRTGFDHRRPTAATLDWTRIGQMIGITTPGTGAGTTAAISRTAGSWKMNGIATDRTSPAGTAVFLTGPRQMDGMVAIWTIIHIAKQLTTGNAHRYRNSLQR